MTKGAYKKLVSRSNNETKKLLIENKALPVFVLYAMPTNMDDKEPELAMGYMLNGQKAIPITSIVNQLKETIDHILSNAS